MILITVKTLNGIILRYHVDTYIVKDGFVEFWDKKTNELKRFHGSNCEIEVLKKEGGCNDY